MNYKKEYKKYLTSSVLDNANNKIASTSFISAFAVYLGLSDLAIGIYAVLDTIMNILQIFAAPLFSRIGQSKKVVLTNYSIYRLASVCFVSMLRNYSVYIKRCKHTNYIVLYICFNICNYRRDGIYNFC